MRHLVYTDVKIWDPKYLLFLFTIVNVRNCNMDIKKILDIFDVSEIDDGDTEVC
jgi:hypothetical protein